ncbi:MAG: hypothetical protein RI894_932 [Bacteroidota bacterium]
MSNTLTALLQTMDNKTRKTFLQYVESPYCNDRPALAKLLTLVFDALKTPQKQPTEACGIWVQAYPEKAFKQADYDEYTHRLTVLLKRFWAAEYLAENEALQTVCLLEALQQKNNTMQHDALQKLQEKTIFTKNKQAAKQNLVEQSLASYTAAWLREDLTDRYYSSIIERKAATKTNTIAASAAADALFLLSKLRYFCMAQNHTAIVATDLEVIGQRFVADWLIAQPQFCADYPLLHAYYLLWNLLQTGENANFQTVFNFLKAEEHVFCAAERNTLYEMLTNFCVKQNRAGKPLFADNAINAYKHGLEKQYFTGSIKKTDAIYTNVVKLLVQQNSTIEALSDLDTWFNTAGKTPISAPILQYCKAYLAFYKKDYVAVLRDMHTISVGDAHLKMDVHCLRLRAYYKIDENDLENLHREQGISIDRDFETYKTTFLMAIKRDKNLPPFLKESYKGFVSNMVALYKYGTTINSVEQKKQQSELIHLIESSTSLLNKAWIFAEIAEINAT